MKTRLLFIILLMVGLLSPGSSYAQKKKASKKNIAIQLYSVRDIIGNNTNYTAILNELGKMGYTAVEAAGYNEGKFYNRTPQEFKKDVEAAGMKVLSSHCSKGLSAEELTSGNFSESLRWWDECIAAHKAAGITYIVTPWLDVPKTVKDLKTYCDYYNV